MTSSAISVTLSAMNWYRFYGSFRHWFPNWTLRRQLAVSEREFRKKLKSAKTVEERTAAHYENYAAWGEMDGWRKEALSEYLTNEAWIRLMNLRDIEWRDPDQFGFRYLQDESLERLSNAVRAEKQKDWDLRLKIASTVGPVIIALAGLVGMITGLVAMFKK